MGAGLTTSRKGTAKLTSMARRLGAETVGLLISRGHAAKRAPATSARVANARARAAWYVVADNDELTAMWKRQTAPPDPQVEAMKKDDTLHRREQEEQEQNRRSVWRKIIQVDQVRAMRREKILTLAIMIQLSALATEAWKSLMLRVPFRQARRRLRLRQASVRSMV